MKSGFKIAAIVLSLTLVVIGCQTTSQGSKTYTRGQAQTARCGSGSKPSPRLF